MLNIIKNKKEINKIKSACYYAKEILEMINNYIKPNITTKEINIICSEYIKKKLKSISAILNYKSFPKSICSSTNNHACHGIPNDRILINGDIINIDVTIKKDNYYGDTSKMFYVGNNANIRIKKLLKISQKSLYIGIKSIKINTPLNIIGYSINKYIEKQNNYHISKDYCGHGIGKNFHENPKIMHYKTHKKMINIKPGMIFTIEPIINELNNNTNILHDKWTVATCNNLLSSQWEHTILITKHGYEILTLRYEEINY